MKTLKKIGYYFLNNLYFGDTNIGPYAPFTFIILSGVIIFLVLIIISKLNLDLFFELAILGILGLLFFIIITKKD